MKRDITITYNYKLSIDMCRVQNPQDISRFCGQTSSAYFEPTPSSPVAPSVRFQSEPSRKLSSSTSGASFGDGFTDLCRVVSGKIFLVSMVLAIE